MKRKYMLLCMLTLCMALFPHAGVCEPLHITDLAQDVPEIWAGEYHVDGEKLTINAPVFIPYVEKLPILRVARVTANETEINRIGQGGAEITDYNIDEVGIGRNDYESVYSYGYFTYVEECFNDFWAVARQRPADTIIAKNQKVSLQTLQDELKKLILNLYGNEIGVQIQKAELHSSFQTTVKPGTYESGGEFPYGDLTGVGGYTIYANQTLRNIPVLLSVCSGFSWQSNTNMAFYEDMYSAQNEITWFYMNDQCYQFLAWNVFSELDEVQADISLCDFSTIKSNLEKQIEKGNIRNVYSLQLGYVIYADPDQKYGNGDKTVSYLLVPTWIARCSYTGGKDPQEPHDQQEAYDYMKNDADYQAVLMNAQTGEIYDPMTSGTQKYYAPRLIQ